MFEEGQLLVECTYVLLPFTPVPIGSLRFLIVFPPLSKVASFGRQSIRLLYLQMSEIHRNKKPNRTCANILLEISGNQL